MILRLPKSAENIDEIDEDSSSKDKSDLDNENVTEILDNSVEKPLNNSEKYLKWVKWILLKKKS